MSRVSARAASTSSTCLTLTRDCNILPSIPTNLPALQARPADTLGRPLQDLRISLTDRCNLRCQYCLPAELFGEDFRFLPSRELLSFEEIRNLVAATLPLGLRKVRLTGGEPLLRAGAPELVAQLRALSPHLELAMTTNGLLLERLAGPLAHAGLQRVNVSLDGLDPEVLAAMAGRPVQAERVLSGILAAHAAGLAVRVNMVVKRGVNENQVLPMAERFRQLRIPLRFIEFMDAGVSNHWNPADVVTGRQLHDLIHRVYPLEREKLTAGDPTAPARTYHYVDGAGEVGFINTISEPFCRGCVRARITAEGRLDTCIFAERGEDLRAGLREEQITTDQITDRLAAIWQGRDDRYSELRSRSGSPGQQRSARPEMWRLGG